MSDLETGALRSDEELRKAVHRFQRLAGLRQTGQMDQDTINFMRRPRCGMADLLTEGRWTATEGGGHHRRHRRVPSQVRGGHERYSWQPQQYTFGPSKWNRTQLTFRCAATFDQISNDLFGVSFGYPLTLCRM